MSSGNEQKHKLALYGGLLGIALCVVLIIYQATSYHYMSREAVSENIIYQEKAELTETMRDAVYFRIFLITYAATIEDYFERDEVRLSFKKQAQNMIRSRERFIEMGMSDEEQRYFDESTRLIQDMRPLVDTTMDLAVDDPKGDLFMKNMSEARWRQLELRDATDVLSNYYEKKLAANNASMQRLHEDAWNNSIALSGLLFVSVLVIAFYIARSESRSRQLLEEAVSKRTAELQAERDRADLANEYKSKFLATMSHELRTPLNAIIGFSDIIRREIMGKINEPQYIEYARDIHNSGSYLLNLISDILDMSKIEAGEYRTDPENFRLHEVVNESLSLLDIASTKKGIWIKNNIYDELPAVNADPRVTKQIIVNLLSNAVKFTPPGGEITLTAKTTDGYLVVTVTDTGIGMTPEVAQAVLEPFIQARHEQQGTGLGLSLCKKFSELQGGSFSLSSEPGRGTRAQFTLPLAGNAAECCQPGSGELQGEIYSGWLPSMSVGVDKWDNDHKKLLDLLRTLPASPNQDMNRREFVAVLDGINEYMETHLLSEERAMQESGYPDYEEHKAAHDQFRQWVSRHRQSLLEDGSGESVHRVTRFIVNWWYSHILKVDMKYKNFFEARPVDGHWTDAGMEQRG